MVFCRETHIVLVLKAEDPELDSSCFCVSVFLVHLFFCLGSMEGCDTSRDGSKKVR